MCNVFQCNAGESDGSGKVLSTLARRELDAALRHMDRMLSGDDAEAFGHFLMMLAALRAVRHELA
jgi:hypothetical protein